MSQANVDLVRYFYDAYDAGDFAGMGQIFARDLAVYVSEFLPWGGSFAGLEGFRDALRLLRRYVQDNFEVTSIEPDGDDVVVTANGQGYFKDSGVPYSASYRQVWKIRDGAVIAFSSYCDESCSLAGIARGLMRRE